MTLADIRDYIASLQLAEHVYSGRMPDKQEKSIGVYRSKHAREHKVAIGGAELSSYGTMHVTLLVHWSRSPGETEKAAQALFDAVCAAWEVPTREDTIKFIQPLYELQDIGTDDAGVFEMVIEAAVIYQKGTGE